MIEFDCRLVVSPRIYESSPRGKDRDRFTALVCHKYLSVGCLGNEMMHGQTKRQAPSVLGPNRENLYTCKERILDVFPRAKNHHYRHHRDCNAVVLHLIPQEPRVY